MSRHVVAATSEIKPGEKKLVTVKGREIGVFNVDGAFFALANRCPHAGGPMCEGRVVGLVQSRGPGNYSIARKGEFVRCPWHGWEFDIRTGQSWCDPDDLKIRQFKTAVEPGAELVKRALHGGDLHGERGGELRGGRGVKAVPTVRRQC